MASAKGCGRHNRPELIQRVHRLPILAQFQRQHRPAAAARFRACRAHRRSGHQHVAHPHRQRAKAGDRLVQPPGWSMMTIRP
jgi:hypothetical protein